MSGQGGFRHALLDEPLGRFAGVSPPRGRVPEPQLPLGPESVMAVTVEAGAAATALRREGVTVAELARRLGYRSEAAFARAFKRVMGSPPGEVRRAAHVA